MAVTKSVAAGTTAVSDPITPPSGAAYGVAVLKADNDGVPLSGDVLEWYYRITTGDPDADPDVADEYTTSDTDRLIELCDTSSVDPSIGHAVVPGEDVKGLKLVAKNTGASGITVSAQIRWMYKDTTAPTETQVQWT